MIPRRPRNDRKLRELAVSTKKKSHAKVASKVIKLTPKAKVAPKVIKPTPKAKVAPKVVKPVPKKGGHMVRSATAASILGVASKNNKAGKFTPAGLAKIKAEWRKYYETLVDLHQRLQDQMSGLAKESAEEMSNYSLHMADSGTDNFDRDFALSLLSSDQDAVYEIEEALRRIERSTYGVCELTNKSIPKARLEAIPWTRFTVEAQAQLERDGALRHKKLGALGSVDSGSGSDADEDEESEEKPSKEKE